MATRKAVVIGDDGVLTELPAGDTLEGGGGGGGSVLAGEVVVTGNLIEVATGVFFPDFVVSINGDLVYAAG